MEPDRPKALPKGILDPVVVYRKKAVIDFYMVLVRLMMQSLVCVNGVAAFAVLIFISINDKPVLTLAHNLAKSIFWFSFGAWCAIVFVCLVTWSQRHFLENERSTYANYMNFGGMAFAFTSLFSFIIGLLYLANGIGG